MRFRLYHMLRAGPLHAAMSPPSPPHAPAPDSAALSAPPCVNGSDPVQWFKQEVHSHDGQLKSWLKGAYPAVRDVDDVVQESYLRIWKAMAAQPIHSAKSFLFTVARHLALNVLRRERNSPVVCDGDLAALGVSEDRPGIVELLTEQEKIDLLGDALVALPSRTRAIFILHKFDGLSQSAVARQLGLTEKAVEHQVARGIRLCEEFFRARGL